MEKKKVLDEATKEGIIQSAEMYFGMFNEFMNMTGKDIALSLQLATGLHAALMQGAKANEKKEEIGKMIEMLGDGNGLTS